MQHPYEHDITALAYDLVEGAERDTLLEHLASCDACRHLYDSYREEQVTVRDSIVRDARSGSAEAKALESTLRMLAGTDAEPKRGRLIRFPTWLIAAEIAAMLLVAVGLFFILKPEDESTDVVPIAESDRAPAVVESGVAYVQTGAGEWKEAEAVPVDEWVSTGPDKFAIRLENGSLTELEPDSVFRISFTADESEPVVYVLRGNGVVNNFGVSEDVLVQSGGANFYTMPGAKLSLAALGSEGELRSWSVPASLRARVISGDVVLGDGSRQVPLMIGETVEWEPSEMRVLTSDAQVLSLTTLGFATETAVFYTYDGMTAGEMRRVRETGLAVPHASGTQVFQVELHEADLLKQIELLLPRLALAEKRAGEEDRWRLDREALEKMRAELSEAMNTQVVTLIENDITLTLVTDGKTLTLTVKDETGTTTYEKNSVEALKAAVSERVAKMLDGLEIKVEDGKFNIAGAHAESSGSGSQSSSATIRIVKTAGSSKGR